jgi:hypothetical protein
MTPAPAKERCMADDDLTSAQRALLARLLPEQVEALRDLADDILAGKRIARLARQLWPWLGMVAFLIWALARGGK